MNRLILIDGNAIMHRAFHALPALTNADGTLTNAVYGFFSMFLKIIDDLKPTHIVVCFDRPKPTFRKMLYAGYQAKRPQMSDDLGPQISIVHDILQEIGVQIFEVDGYEADDLIGTISCQAVEQSKKEQMEVIILSGDRDLLQLVNPSVMMLAPIIGMTNMVLYNEATVKEKFRISPSQIIDYKSLVGDASDNYPGVSGIGPKTAADLLIKYHTLENLYSHINELPEKIAKKLAVDAEQAALAKKLATIILDAPISLKLHLCTIDHLNYSKALKLFEEKGFNSLVKRYEKEKKIPDQQKQTQKGKAADKNVQLGLL